MQIQIILTAPHTEQKGQINVAIGNRCKTTGCVDPTFQAERAAALSLGNIVQTPSEMFRGDPAELGTFQSVRHISQTGTVLFAELLAFLRRPNTPNTCLLYTSDAADE